MAYLSVDERRRRIIDAAVEVLATEGLARLTTRRIAEKAESPLGALHYCFRNKDELIAHVVRRGADMVRDAFEEDVDPSLGLEATIRRSVDALWLWYRDNIGLQLALMELGLYRIRRGGKPKDVYAMWDPFGRDLLLENLRRAVEVEGAEPAIPVDEIVRFILHRFDGLTLEYAASKDATACERQMQLLADALVVLAVPASAARRRGPRAVAG